jgi:hypothetical protein
MPEETKMQTEVLNDVAEEIKKISNVVTDGLMKIKDNSENTNFEIKNLSSAMSNVKETVNNISLTTDNQNEIQQTQIESLNLLIQETKTSKDELKSSIEKQSKNQSELFKKQTDEIKKSNIQLKEQNKGFKKLTKSIDDLDVGDKGGSGGGLLGLIGSMLSGPVVALITGALATILTGLAAAGIGTILYKKFIEPYIEEKYAGARGALGKPSTKNIPLLNAKGENVYDVESETPGTPSKIMSESEIKEELKTTNISEKRKSQLESALKDNQIQRVVDVATNQEISSSTSMMAGKTTEEMNKIRESNRSNPEKTIKNDIQRKVLIADTKIRKTIGDMNTKWLNVYDPDDESEEQRLKRVKLLGEWEIEKNLLFQEVKNTAELVDKSQNLTENDKKEIINTSPFIKNYFNPTKSPESDWGFDFVDMTYAGMFKESRYKELDEAAYSMRDARGRKDTVKIPEKTTNLQIPEIDNSSPMANEGIIEGTRLGSRIIAGENYTSEAVISTKPNMVTEKIGENLYETIKQKSNNDVMSLPKESMMLQDGLNRSKAEYFDMTKAQPLASQAQGGTSIVNNILGGNSSDRSDPNTQFNPYMLSMNNPDNLAKEVLYEIKKAELL